ncbi:Serine/threonine-protein kinase PknB [Maioricimonas rarisocia]|uniref:Serine/threonine-protein kinase PknB n=2 Tax=Maioricimonas rarisocia TaxID=2528026 RepID=A0A517Z0E1_9PLAN|nr:Serine/threonine-protein kinase PknB [Maioricimonas rarisocia]
MSISLRRFTHRVIASGVLTSLEIQEFTASLPSEGRPVDGEQLARALVRARKLTAYQAQQIYRGNGKDLVRGNYIILDEIGQGGMGTVFKAEHRRMHRIVALKTLSSSISESAEARARFLREVRVAAQLDHPHIVAAFDADRAGDSYFLVMKYVEGEDLSSLVRRQGPLPNDKAVDCVRQAALGLQYAHDQGVIHRDVKPSNLLLDTTGTVRVLDLGLARFTSDDASQSDLTGSGAVMGTVDYMAPEQAQNTKLADTRSDIYSLGCTLFFLLTGRPVYDGETIVQKLLAHREAPLPSLLEVAGVSVEFDVAFRKMIAKAPDDRYQAMAELVCELPRLASPVTVMQPASPGTEDSRLEAFLEAIGTPSSPVRPHSVPPSPDDAGADRTASHNDAHVATSPGRRQVNSRPYALTFPSRTRGKAAFMVRAAAVVTLLAGLSLLGVRMLLFAPAAPHAPQTRKPPAPLNSSRSEGEVPDDAPGTGAALNSDKRPPAVPKLVTQPGADPLRSPPLSQPTAEDVSDQTTVESGSMNLAASTPQANPEEPSDASPAPPLNMPATEKAPPDNHPKEPDTPKTIQVGPGEGMRPNLRDALAEATGGDTIELCQNEPLTISARTHIWNRPGGLTLRAGEGFTPVLVAQSSSESAARIGIYSSGDETETLLVDGLTFVDLNERNREPLFVTNRAATFRNCQWILQQQAVLGDSSVRPVELHGCYIWRRYLGSQNVTLGTSGDLKLTNCLLVGDGYIASSAGTASVEATTFVATRNAFTVTGSTAIHSERNLFVGLEHVIGFWPLQDGDVAQAREWLSDYAGVDNVYFRCLRFAPQLAGSNPAGDFVAWQRFIGNRERNPLLGDPGFVRPDLVVSARQRPLPPGAFQLRPGGAARRRKAGCDVDRLRPLPRAIGQIVPEEDMPTQ